MKVILLGKGQMLANMIESARESGVEIAGIFRYERTVMSGAKLLFHDLFQTSHDLTLIKKYNLPEIKCKSANSEAFRNYILKTNADIIMVGTWKEKLKKETFSMPKIGTVNIHPSLLPRYRGPNPYMQVILRGEKKTGVTLHLMDENLDTGAILIQKEIDILPSDTGKELRERAFTMTREIASEFFSKIQSEVIIPIKQNENRATYFGNIDETIKMLDFKNKSSEELYATIRALHPWLPCYITIGNHFLSVNPYKVKIETAENKSMAEALYKTIHGKTSDDTDAETLGHPGEIIAKDGKTRSLTIVCKDGKALKMDGLKLWGFFIRPFTGIFIRNVKLS